MNVPYSHPAPREGEILAGKYRVERVLGAGGMGFVVAAMHVHLRERVALKFLHPLHATRPDTVARFLREAQSAVRIKSEHVGRITDVGTLENGAPYIVMEFLTGTDLAQLLASRGHLPLPEAVEYVLQACEAVAEAHAMGMIHRDLKPANLFLARRPDGSPLVKVLDFGISKAIDPQTTAEQQALTTTAAVMGSPLYMSPEQVRSSKTVDARSDVWSLGVVLYELLSNKHPFEAETMTALLASIVADPPVPLRAHRPELPPAVEQLVMTCLEKDPARRVASVAHFAQALAPFAPPRAQLSVERVSSMLGNVLASSRPSLPGPMGATGPGAGSQTGNPSWGNTVRPRRQSATLGIGIGVAVLVLGGGAAAVALLAGGAKDKPPAAERMTNAPATNAAAAAPASAAAPLEPEPKATATTSAEAATTSEPTAEPPVASTPSAVAAPAPSTAKTAAAKPALLPNKTKSTNTTSTATAPTKVRDVLDTR